jgi:hypothetical protein
VEDPAGQAPRTASPRPQMRPHPPDGNDGPTNPPPNRHPWLLARSHAGRDHMCVVVRLHPRERLLPEVTYIDVAPI